MKHHLTIILMLVLSGMPPHEAAGSVCLAHTRLDNGHWQVWTSDLDGANPRRISNSPWDKRGLRLGDSANVLLVRDNEGRLRRLNLNGTGTDSLVTLEFEIIKDFDFSSNAGFLIASYAPNALDNVCIWQVDGEGKERRLLISEPYLNEMPRWLSKGTRFLFAKSHAGKSYLCVSDVIQPKTTTLLKQSPASASEPCPSPDGTQIAFCGQARSSMDLWICDVDGSAARELYAGAGLEAEPAWSLDGQWVYFTTWDGRNFRIARVRPSGKDFQLISLQGVDSRCPVVVNLTGDQHE